MNSLKNDAYYVNRILEDLRFVQRHMDGTGPDVFSHNEILQDSMMFRLIQISENARKLSEDYRENHRTIPWTAIFGLRNRLVHDYGSVDYTVIYETLTGDIPQLLEMLSADSL